MGQRSYLPHNWVGQELALRTEKACAGKGSNRYRQNWSVERVGSSSSFVLRAKVVENCGLFHQFSEEGGS